MYEVVLSFVPVNKMLNCDHPDEAIKQFCIVVVLIVL